MMKLAVGWIVILVAIVFAARKFWKDAPLSQPTPQISGSTQVINSAEDQFLISEASPLCGEVLSAFLKARTPEERNQFVSSPITTAARMANFYLTNPLEAIDTNGMILQNAAIAHLPGGDAVELQLGSREGQLLDVAFLKENDEWRIDWNHFVRYSETPWQLFLAGSGDAEGEFRLLARERLAEERKNADTISLVLYAPRFGYTRDTGLQSPEFLVRRDTREGKLLDAAFKQERSGKRPFGVNLPSINPEGLIRVRVKIRRTTADLERHLEIEKVIACHWYSTDEPGVEITDEPAENEGDKDETNSPGAPASLSEAVPARETSAETLKHPGE